MMIRTKTGPNWETNVVDQLIGDLQGVTPLEISDRAQPARYPGSQPAVRCNNPPSHRASYYMAKWSRSKQRSRSTRTVKWTVLTLGLLTLLGFTQWVLL